MSAARPLRPRGETARPRSPTTGPCRHAAGGAACAAMADRLTSLDALLPAHGDRQRAHARGVAGALPSRARRGRPSRSSARAGAGRLAARLGSALSPAPRLPAAEGSRAGVGRGGRLRRAAARASPSRATARRCSCARFDALSDTSLSRPLGPHAPAVGDPPRAAASATAPSGSLMKIHHALVDGKSALAVRAAAARPRSRRRPSRPAAGLRTRFEAGRGSARLAVDALVDSGTEPLRALGRAARAAGSPTAGWRHAGGGRRWRSARTCRARAVVIPQRSDRAAANARRPHAAGRGAARGQARP
jgi:hypothetical protein